MRVRNEDALLTLMSHLPVYLMTEWKSQTGEYLTRDHDREPNIFLSIILCENLSNCFIIHFFRNNLPRKTLLSEFTKV